MSRFLGIDVGTSAVKVLVVDEDQAVRARATAPLTTHHPAPLASEQNADDWWAAVSATLDELAAAHPEQMQQVAAVGLSGQMHTAVLLDAEDRPLRPAMLWNDGRAEAEAAELRALGPSLALETGVPAMTGFTAPKLLWLARRQPQTLSRAKSLLPAKDYIRLRLTGQHATDVSEAAGTWLLDQARRQWSDNAIAAIQLDRRLLPPVVEGTALTGEVRTELARRFGMRPGVPVAGGASDTPAGGIGIGAVEEGRGFAALSTSAQLFVTTDSYRPAPERLVHSFCHAVPDRWYQMAAMLNGASVLAFVADLLGEPDIGLLLAETEAAFTARPSPLLMLPYLAGERTPHNDPHARGVVFGLTPATRRTDLVQAALEGVAFTFADALAALQAAGTRIDQLGFIGGGARSRLWGLLLASVLATPLRRYAAGELGAPFGVTRVARLALQRDTPDVVLREPPLADLIEPNPDLSDAYQPRVEAFRRLYAAVRDEFRLHSAHVQIR